MKGKEYMRDKSYNLSENGKKPLGVYIHIPFCVRKCSYCDFLSHPVGTDCLAGLGVYREKYINGVCTELGSYGDLAGTHVVDTVYIGGGTPSLIGGDDIVRIMAALRQSFEVSGDAEISIEVNPGTLTTDKAYSYIEAGINRMSIGLQSAQENELAALGRIHNYDQFLAAYNTAREAGFRNINIDIMSGIPGQTMRSYLDTIDKVLRCAPEHISSYSLIVEEGTPLASDEALLQTVPDEDTDREMYDMTRRLLEAGGYRRYEISNYAKHGFECRHNKVYWTLGDYIGVGIGAASFARGRRYTNTGDIAEYTDIMERYGERGFLAQADDEFAGKLRHVDEDLDAERLMEEYMFLGLRMIDGVSAERFNDMFGHSIYDIYGDVIDRYVRSGHLVCDKGIIRLSRSGIDVSNAIMADFLLE